jgi:hypothetical protein
MVWPCPYGGWECSLNENAPYRLLVECFGLIGGGYIIGGGFQGFKSPPVMVYMCSAQGEALLEGVALLE